MTLVKPGGRTHGDLDVLDILRRQECISVNKEKHLMSQTNLRRCNGLEELEVVHVERLGSSNLALNYCGQQGSNNSKSTHVAKHRFGFLDSGCIHHGDMGNVGL